MTDGVYGFLVITHPLISKSELHNDSQVAAVTAAVLNVISKRLHLSDF